MSLNRSVPIEKMVKYLDSVLVEYDKNPEWQKYVVGADFCGVPWEGDINNFVELFQLIRDKNIKLTTHTAELAVHAYETSDMLKFKPERVGHFCYATDEEMKVLAAYGGLVEICPTSNLVTGEMNDLDNHPILKMVENGVKYTICTDDLLLFNRNVSEEIFLMSQSHPELFTLEKIQKI
jgi:adenosine deaminase